MPDAIAEPARVFITDELACRPNRQPDYRREKEAFRWLLAELAEAPDKILPEFVSTAMDLLRGSSAGISLLEAEPAPGVFRWHHLHGDLAKFENATAPRNSPCGVTLDRNAPVLAAHPERVYEWIAEAGITIPEVLLVPLYNGSTRPLGTLWVVGDEAEHFCPEDVRLARELADFVGTALRIVQTEGHLVEALHQQELLAREMSHRVKNVFALAQSLIRLSAKAAKSPDELADALSGRFNAVAAAHELVRQADGIKATTSLRELITAVVRPYEQVSSPKTSISGPRVACGQAAANGLVLVLHELTTNAVKYGALSSNSGHLAVTWEILGESLVLTWNEDGAPPSPERPRANGFGTTLIERTLTRQFAGTFERTWLPGGVSCTLSVPMAKLTS